MNDRPIGDGVTDDTAAIQALLDRGGSLGDLPPGTYLITGELRDAFRWSPDLEPDEEAP